jgi:transposase
MPSKPDDLPEDLASAYLALLSEREVLQAERDVVVAERDRAVAQAAKAQALLSDSEALIASLELAIEKLKRELRGQRSERAARLIDQLELQLEELVMAATEDEVAAQAAARSSNGRPFMRRRPVRKPWPENIERERVVIAPRRPVHAAVARACRNWARTSPRRWRRSRVGSK